MKENTGELFNKLAVMNESLNHDLKDLNSTLDDLLLALKKLNLEYQWMNDNRESN